MDKYLLWHQLSLIQQLNCVCDTTAKGAVYRAVTTGHTSTPTQILPREDISIVIDRNCNVLPLSLDDILNLNHATLILTFSTNKLIGASLFLSLRVQTGSKVWCVVHKIHTRGPLRSAHVKKYSHCEYIAPPTFIGIQSYKKNYIRKDSVQT